MEEKLGSFLKAGADWARLKTSLSGVFVLKLPPFRSSPARLAVELNPVDDTGNPTRRRGLILRNEGDLIEYERIYWSDKPGEDVLEI